MLKSISLVLLLCLPVAAMAQTNDVVEPSVQEQNSPVTIHLKDGSVLEGKITDSDETTITIQPYSGGQITISRSHIKEIKAKSFGQITVELEKTNQVKRDKPPLSAERIAGEILAGVSKWSKVLSVFGYNIFEFLETIRHGLTRIFTDFIRV